MPVSAWCVAIVVCLAVSAPSAAQQEGDGVAEHGNRLVNETSPYLLQHAHNPVDWYPWGEEAFAAARERGVPIFLSIGYSTCYWCHVMEREVFENEAIAKEMNEQFVCVKVDREQRPDVDDIYMTATVLYTGRGGWPMSVFLEPAHLRPFFCGTYFPPEPAMGMASFPQVMEAVSHAWEQRRDAVVEAAESLAQAVRAQAARGEAVALGEGQVTQAASALVQVLDRVNGGFGGAPKFPQPSFLEFLLDVRMGAGDEATASAFDEAIKLTLDRMAIGGVHDQVGGGFHRYAVDATWTVPHFEKMLYDNGQLASVYARAARLYDDEFYARIARETCAYVLREMQSPEGGFYSAQDAEVDGREGLNYLWTPGQLEAALGAEDAAFASRVYGVDGGSNFQDPHHPEDGGKSVLRLESRPAQVASSMGMDVEALEAKLDAIDARLLEARGRRTQARTDDKVLTAWNGLMIAGMADAGAALGDAGLVASAARGADFVCERMLRDDGTLLRVYREGEAGTEGFLEDYAFLAHGLISLERAQEALGEVSEGRQVARAEALVAAAKARFGAKGGGFYDTREGQQDLFVRTRSTSDGATPSGTSVMIEVLLDLHEMTGKQEYLDDALGTLRSISAEVAANPTGPINATRSLLRMLSMEELAGNEAIAGIDEGAAKPDGFTPVEIFAPVDRVTVGKDAPAQFTIRLSIADGYHVLAADPGEAGEGLIPLRVHAVGGRGIDVYADYPTGTRYAPAAGYADELLVYTGEVEVTVAVARNDEAWAGTPLVGVTYQACTDTACERPVTVELEVAIDEE